MPAYFNNAATTFPKPESVYQFMDTYYRESGFSTGRGQIKSSNNIIKETRSLILELLHCSNKKVAFTHSATEAINIILQGIDIEDGCNVYVSPFEHNAVNRVLGHLKATKNIKIIDLYVTKLDLHYDLEKIENQFEENPPHIVIISHASNVCGLVAPIHDICSLSYKYQAINIVDMCQTVGLIDTDISSNIFEFVVFAGHKTLYGPFGIAGFICSGDIKPNPLILGGTGIDSANLEVPITMPERYEVGSQNILAISGLYAALNWIKDIGISAIYKKEKENHSKLLALLLRYDNIALTTPIMGDSSIGVISCNFSGYSSDNMGQVLSELEIEVRTGLHCAPTAHKFLGTFPAGTVRFSVSYFTTDEDFEKLKTALDYISENS